MIENDIIAKKKPLEIVDEIEVAMQGYKEVECPLVHRFTPSMYIREIFMPAGSLITSKLHRTEHPFTISKGAVSVLTIEGGYIKDELLLEAPYTGITKPGTRRVLYIHEDTVWTTYHYNESNETDVSKIEERIIEPYVNPLLSGGEMKDIEGLYKRNEVELQKFIKSLNE